MALPEVKVRITADDRGLDRGLNRATKALAGFAAKATAGTITALAGVATGFVLATRNAINFADEMAKTSQRIGVTTEALSKLQYAAKLSDVSLSDLRVGLSQLARNMDMNSDAFERLGVVIRNQDGSLRDTGDVFNDLVERFSLMQDGAQKTALAMEIFGRSGANMIPLLNAGAAGLKSMTDEASIFGITISKQAGKNAENFNDNLTRLSTAFQGLATRVAEDVLPHLVGFTNKLVDFVKNEKAIKEAADVIARGFIAVGGAAVDAAGLVGKLVIKLNDFIESSKGFFRSTQLAEENAKKFGISVAAINYAMDKYGTQWPKIAAAIRDGKYAFVEVNDAVKENMEVMKQANEQSGATGGAGPAAPLFSADMLNRHAQLGEQVKAEYALLGERIEFLRENFMTEQELLQSKYDQDLAMLDEYYRNKSDKDGQYADLRYRLEEQLKKDLEKLDQQKMQTALQSTGMMFGGLAQLAQLGGKKLFNIAKAFSIAEAVMNTAQAVTKTYTSLPYPFNIPAAIGQAAAGAAQIATIASTQPGAGAAALRLHLPPVEPVPPQPRRLLLLPLVVAVRRKWRCS